LVSDLLQRLQGSKYFSKLDLRWGYNNVRIKEGDEGLAAFNTNRGLFEPTVMFFGLCNSPATFQTMMNCIFKDMIDEGWLDIYIDDMLIFGKTPNETRTRTQRVLQRLRENDLFLKLEKCKFGVTEVEFLGMIISEGRIRMDSTKLSGIASWPEPKTVKQIRSFLGFANFYRKFIGNFAAIVVPLTELTKKDHVFKWTIECQSAFATLKRKFLEEPVLVMPDVTKPFYIETDASNWAVGAVLKQRGADGELHPCGYLSHRLTPTEQRYQVYDRELLAVKAAFDSWHHLLKGAAHMITVYCDHKNLSYWKHPQLTTARQARWWQDLAEFNYKVDHIPGVKNTQADALSRRSDHVEDGEEDLKKLRPQVMLTPEMVIAALSDDIQDRILKALETDNFAIMLKNTLKHGKTPIKSKLMDWDLTPDGFITYNSRCYVPEDLALRSHIIKVHHDTPAMGHPGRLKTCELIRRDYWWPGMTRLVSKWVEGCAMCQQAKVNTHPT